MADEKQGSATVSPATTAQTNVHESAPPHIDAPPTVPDSAAPTLRAPQTRAVPAGDHPVDRAHVANAEAALAKLSVEFTTWIEEDCARLDTARRQVHRQGLNGWTIETLFQAAHDIKGEAATLGHPLVEGVAKNLCRLIEHTRDQAGIPVVLIDQHVDAILAIVRAPTNFAAARLAGRLTSELTRVTAEYLIREDMSALGTDYRVDSPPLAPDSATH